MNYEHKNYKHKAITFKDRPEYFEDALNHSLIPDLNDGWEIILQTPVTPIEEEIRTPLRIGERRGDKITKLCVTFVLRKKIL